VGHTAGDHKITFIRIDNNRTGGADALTTAVPVPGSPAVTGGAETRDDG